MSPSWRDTVHVGVCPDRLLFARYAKGLRPRLRTTETLRLPAEALKPAWRTPMAALRETLSERAGLSSMVVVLSNHFVRYALLPWSRELRSDAEWLDLARHVFVSTHGPIATGWDLRVSAHRGEGPRIASAVDAELIEALYDACRTAGVVPMSVQPYLMTALNRAREAFVQGPAWFALSEPGRLAMAYFGEGACKHLRVSRDTGPRATLTERVRQEAAVAGIDDCERVVFMGDVEPGCFPDAATNIEDYTLRERQEPSHREFAMVLA